MITQDSTQILQLTCSQAGVEVEMSGNAHSATGYAPLGPGQTIFATATTAQIGPNAPVSGTTDEWNLISIKNTYAGANTITLQKVGAVTTHSLYCTLQQNERAEYTHAAGWRTLDANGQLKVTLTATAGNFAVGGNLTVAGTSVMTGLLTANAGISIPTGQSITGAGTAAISGFASVGGTSAAFTNIGGFALTGGITSATNQAINIGSGSLTAGAGSFTTGVFNAAATLVATFTSNGATSYGGIRVISPGAGNEASMGFRTGADADAASWVIGKNVNGTDGRFGFYYGGAKVSIGTDGSLTAGAGSFTTGVFSGALVGNIGVTTGVFNSGVSPIVRFTSPTSTGNERTWAIVGQFAAYGDLTFRQGTSDTADPVSSGTTIAVLSSTGLAVTGTISTTASSGTGTAAIIDSFGVIRPLTSDENDKRILKRNWQPKPTQLAAFLALSPVISQYKTPGEWPLMLGHTAQDLAKVDPYLVNLDDEGHPVSPSERAILAYQQVAIANINARLVAHGM